VWGVVDFTRLLERGFHGIGLDLIKSDRGHKADERTGMIEFRSITFLIKEQFELVVAFEVLGYYDQDSRVAQWRNSSIHGTQIFSVPAHMKHWTNNDKRAGQVRREKPELLEKLEKVGLNVQEIWVWFPNSQLTHLLSSRFS
jgi:hypothetical protein